MSKKLILSLPILATLICCIAITATAQTVTADFGSRVTNSRWIPAGMFGINSTRLGPNSGAMAQVHQAGFNRIRRMAGIPAVYATSTPNWSYLDFGMRQAINEGVQPLLVMSSTPKWLQPNPNPC